jgi:hypothetical protein
MKHFLLLAKMGLRGDMEHDILPAILDRGEDVNMMEPTLLAEGSRFSRFRLERTDMAVELPARSPGFRRSLLGGL